MVWEFVVVAITSIIDMSQLKENYNPTTNRWKATDDNQRDSHFDTPLRVLGLKYESVLKL